MPYLHHILIHFPIALGLLSAAAAGLAIFRPTPLRDDATRLLSYLAAIAAVAAAVAGLLSAGHLLDEGSVASASVFRHRNVALVSTSVLVASACLGWIGHRRSSARLVLSARIGALIGGFVVAAAGHFGGDMLHPGIAPWSDVAHAHGHGMVMPDDDAAREDHAPHDAASPKASSTQTSVLAAAPSAATTPPTATTMTTEPTHRHTSPVNGARADAASTATPSPVRPTDSAPAPGPSTTVPPMMGMPPGHQM